MPALPVLLPSPWGPSPGQVCSPKSKGGGSSPSLSPPRIVLPTPGAGAREGTHRVTSSSSSGSLWGSRGAAEPPCGAMAPRGKAKCRGQGVAWGCGDKRCLGEHVWARRQGGDFTAGDTPRMLARSGHYPLNAIIYIYICLYIYMCVYFYTHTHSHPHTHTHGRHPPPGPGGSTPTRSSKPATSDKICL